MMMKMKMKIPSFVLAMVAISSLTGLTVAESDAQPHGQIRKSTGTSPQDPLRRKTTAKRIKGALRKNHKTANNNNNNNDDHRFLKKDDSKDDGDGDDNGSDIDVDDILGFGCFSEVASAQVEGRGDVPMKDLQVGDMVLTSTNDYQPIYVFGHRSPNVMAEFYQLHTKETHLEVTGEHLIYLKDQAYPVRADSLRVGDSLRGNHHEGSMEEKTIIKIETIQRRGLYAPFTPQGTIVVNGISASSYISLQESDQAKTGLVELSNGVQLSFLSQHDLIHTWLSPLRLICMGISSNFCRQSQSSSKTMITPDGDDDGLPSFMSWSLDLSLWVDQQHFTVQTLILVSFIVVYVPILVMEKLLGPSLAPLAIFVLCSLLFGGRFGGSGADRRRKKKQQTKAL